MPLELVVDRLSAERGGRIVFSDISFGLAEGKALLVTGPNGAGKTTLLRIIAGFLAPSTGRVSMKGGDPELTVAEQSHFVGHKNALRSRLTVAETSGFWARYLGGTQETTESALARFGLAALGDAPAGYLSVGQRRRLGLARLLLAPRPLWLLDEPTASLDSAAVATIEDVLGAHLRSGGLAVVATHGPLGLPAARELRLQAD
jgi:heme exporter protein A